MGELQRLEMMETEAVRSYFFFHQFLGMCRDVLWELLFFFSLPPPVVTRLSLYPAGLSSIKQNQKWFGPDGDDETHFDERKQTGHSKCGHVKSW